ncbi:MAG: hypothetical protein WBE48_24185 [Xanthobacteraceae bacterium]
MLSTIAVFVLTSTAVRAADLARPYAPPPPPYPFSVGGVAGTSNLNSSGFFGGGQIGYNWQFAPAWVAGRRG